MTDLLQTLLDDAVGSGESDAAAVFGDNADRTEQRNEEFTGISESPQDPEQPPQ